MSRQEKEDVLCNLCGQHITWWFPIETEDGKLYHRDCYNHMKKLIEELTWMEDAMNKDHAHVPVTETDLNIRKFKFPKELGEMCYDIIEVKTKRTNATVEPIEDAGGQSTVEGAVQKDCASKGEE